jgi:hypothetical protein
MQKLSNAWEVHKWNIFGGIPKTSCKREYLW